MNVQAKIIDLKPRHGSKLQTYMVLFPNKKKKEKIEQIEEKEAIYIEVFLHQQLLLLNFQVHVSNILTY